MIQTIEELKNMLKFTYDRAYNRSLLLRKNVNPKIYIVNNQGPENKGRAIKKKGQWH